MPSDAESAAEEPEPVPAEEPEPVPDRHIRLDGPANFRDLGGYPVADGRTVRWRRIFRSDGLDTLSAADLAHLVEELGLASIIDLRTGEEVQRVGRGPLGGTELAFHHIPIIDETRRLLYARGGAGLRIADLYSEMAERAADRFVAAIRIVAATDSPIVFHCAAGKDRTGLLGALLLDLMGVSDEDIVDDYALSAAITPILRQRLEARRAARAASGATGGTGPTGAEATGTGGTGTDDTGTDGTGATEAAAPVPDELLSARPATIIGVLEAIRASHGSVEDWARAHGLPHDELERLRDRMLV